MDRPPDFHEHPQVNVQLYQHGVIDSNSKVRCEQRRWHTTDEFFSLFKVGHYSVIS